MGSGKGYELAPFDPYAKQPKMSYKVRATNFSWLTGLSRNFRTATDVSCIAVALTKPALWYNMGNVC